MSITAEFPPRAEHAPKAATLIAGERLISLDAFRGITIAAMLLVNNPGTWSAVYPPLLHKTWHGWTPTDLIFPFFLFIVGTAIAFAFQKRLDRGVEKAPLLLKVLWRSLIIFGLGLFISAYPFVTVSPEVGLIDFSTLRIPGVLQRIAVCYLVVSILFLYVRPRWEFVIAGVLLFGYWAALEWVPVPGYGAGAIDEPAGTLTAYLDRLIFGNHLWAQSNRQWDPSGLVGTIPAIVSTLMGVWAGRLLLSDRTSIEKTARVLVWGLAALTAGYVWDWFLPINKPLWTSSYVLLSGGLAMCGLGVCYWITDVKGRSRWAGPFVAYGVNAITLYVLSELLVKTLITIRLPGGQSVKGAVYDMIFAPIGPPRFSSLLFAVAWVLLLYLLARWLYRRAIIIKV